MQHKNMKHKRKREKEWIPPWLSSYQAPWLYLLSAYIWRIQSRLCEIWHDLPRISPYVKRSKYAQSDRTVKIIKLYFLFFLCFRSYNSRFAINQWSLFSILTTKKTPSILRLRDIFRKSYFLLGLTGLGM